MKYLKKLFLLLTIFLIHCPAGYCADPETKTYVLESIVDRRGVEVPSPDGSPPNINSTIQYGQTFGIRLSELPPIGEISSLFLYVNGYPFRQYKVINYNPAQGILFFDINKDTWTGSGNLVGPNLYNYLGQERKEKNKISIELGQSVRDVNKVISVKPKEVSLVFVTANMHALYWLIITATLLIFIILARCTNIIKDVVGDLVAYSLVKAQLAFWSLIIICLYLYIYLVLQTVPAINATVLTLLGISITATGISITKNPARYKNIYKMKLKSDGKEKPKWKFGFLFDILNDGHGVSIHRFQYFIFTLIFGYVFISGTLSTLEFVTFDNTQLALMGISASGYVGLKLALEG